MIFNVKITYELTDNMNKTGLEVLSAGMIKSNL